MELGKYVKDYTAAVEAREREAKLEEERERNARLLNAEKVEKWLKDVVAPVFQKASQQLKEAGCASEVVWESKSDPNYPVSPVDPAAAAAVKTFALRIDLGAQPPAANPKLSPPGSSHLRYVGSFNDRAVTHSTDISGSGISPTTRESLKIEQVTSTVIEGHVEAFVKRVFAVSGRS